MHTKHASHKKIKIKNNQQINDYLVTYIQKDIFKIIEYKEIMQQFQNMKNR